MNDFKLDSELRIKSGFLTPDNYFDSLADRVMLSLPLKEVKVVPLYRRRPVWVTSVAAVFILSFSLIFTQKEDAVQLPDNAAIENYLMNQSGIGSYELQQNMNESGISSSELKQNLNKEASDTEQSFVISDEAIEEYLSGENIYSYE